MRSVDFDIGIALILWPERCEARIYNSEKILDREEPWFDLLVERVRVRQIDRSAQTIREDVTIFLTSCLKQSSNTTTGKGYQLAWENYCYFQWWSHTLSALGATINFDRGELFLEAHDLEGLHRLLGLVDNQSLVAMLAMKQNIGNLDKMPDWPPVPRIRPAGAIEFDSWLRRNGVTDTHLHLGGCSINEFIWHFFIRSKDTYLQSTNIAADQRRTLAGLAMPFGREDPSLLLRKIFSAARYWKNNVLKSSIHIGSFSINGQISELNHYEILAQERICIQLRFFNPNRPTWSIDELSEFDDFLIGKSLLHIALTQTGNSGEGLAIMVEIMGLANSLRGSKSSNLFSNWHRFLFLACSRHLKSLEIRLSAYDDPTKLINDLILAQKLWRSAWLLRKATINRDNRKIQFYTNAANITREITVDEEKEVPTLRVSIFLRKDADLSEIRSSNPTEPKKLKSSAEQKLLHKIYMQTAIIHKVFWILAKPGSKFHRKDIILHRIDVAGLERYIPTWPFHFALKLLRGREQDVKFFVEHLSSLDKETVKPWAELIRENKIFRPYEGWEPNFCIHAGEEFYTPLDGLTQIGHLFLADFYNYDIAIGHGLVLGLDVPQWFQRGGGRTRTPAGILFDSLLWLHLIAERNGIGKRSELAVLQSWIIELKERIYGHLPSLSIQFADHLHYLLDIRSAPPCGIHPTRLEGNIDWTKPDLAGISRYKRRPFILECIRMRQAERVDKLVQQNRNLWDDDVRMTLIIPIIQGAQAHLCREAALNGVVIEFSPTSNQRVYKDLEVSELPTFKLINSQKLDIHIRHTINTDDPGTFNTRIETEYALYYDALLKGSKPDSSDDRLITKNRQNQARHRLEKARKTGIDVLDQ